MRSSVFIVSSTSAQAGPSTLASRCAMLNSVRIDCTFLGASTSPLSAASAAAASAETPLRGDARRSPGCAAPPRGLIVSPSPPAPAGGQASANSHRFARKASRGSSSCSVPQACVNVW